MAFCLGTELFVPQALLEKFGDTRFKVGEDDYGNAVKLKLKYFFEVVHTTVHLAVGI